MDTRRSTLVEEPATRGPTGASTSGVHFGDHNVPQAFSNNFKVEDTSYGRTLELVLQDNELANGLPSSNEVKAFVPIVDISLKFKQSRLRKGYNIERCHHDYLINFNENPNV